ncbi:MAG TPA: pyridoxal phosphate-dependent aminotransferase [bacterium]
MLADRLRQIEGSPTLALTAKTKALAAAGKSVVDFAAGEPDFPTPEPIKQAAVRAIERNRTRYTPVAGTPELRQAVADSLNAARGTRYTAAETIVACGAKHALANIFQAVCQPGDDVLIPAPYWVSFPPMVRLAGANPVIVHTKEADGFCPDPQAMERAATAATKAVIVNSPNNPTGAVIDPGTLAAIWDVARRRKWLIISDEIYAELVYPPAEHASIVQVAPEAAAQTVVVSGVSKTYSMTGWRIGYAAGPKHVIDAMIKIQSHSTSNPTTVSQDAALAALTGDQGAVAAMRAEFQRRRDRMLNGMQALSGCRCASPRGAFYLWCNVEALGQSSEATAAQWLEQALVAAVPGEGFGAPGWIRMSFATSMEMIEEGLARVSRWWGDRAS